MATPAPTPVLTPVAPVIEKEATPTPEPTPVIVSEKEETQPVVETCETPAGEDKAVGQETPKETAPVTLTSPKAEKPVVAPEKKITPAEMTPSEDDGESALEIEENPLSDKEIKEYTQYLLETNPALNKNQASFLASHCTMGRYYTIQQFKKFTRCAYETARTSMDKLAQERYYSKLQVKNKFVYTPRKKGEGK